MVFLKALDDVSAEERGTLTLQCEVSDQHARVVWRKDGVELGPSDKYDFLHTAGTRGLVVHGLTRDDAGLYTCDVGTDETRARVSVHGACGGPPQTVGRGSGVSLRGACGGQPQMVGRASGASCGRWGMALGVPALGGPTHSQRPGSALLSLERSGQTAEGVGPTGSQKAQVQAGGPGVIGNRAKPGRKTGPA